MVLSVLRKKARSIFIYVIFAIIIVVFIFFFGWGEIRERQENWIIKINDRSVSYNTYLNYYNQLLNFYQEMYKEYFDKGLIEKLGVKQRAIDTLIENFILLEMAEKINIITPESEVKRSLRETPIFQNSGKFDFKKYEQLLRLNRITPEDFERKQKEEAMGSLIRNFILNAVKCSETELWEQFRKEQEKINLEYVEIAPEAMETGGSFQAKEIRQYYNDNKEKFRIPERIKIVYLEFSPRNFEKKAEVSQGETEEYYKNFSEEFWEPRKVHARHILVKVNPDAKEEERESARKKAEEILSLIRQGKPFEEMAKQYSQDLPSAQEGGDLGFFPRGQMVKPFEEEAFKLQPGEVSNVVKTQFGFHIIKADEIKEEGVRPLGEVKEKISKELAGEKTKELIKKEAHRAYRALLKDKDLKKYADKNELRAVETDYFSKDKILPPFGLSDELAQELFSLSPGEMLYPYFIADSYYLIKLSDKQKSHLLDLNEAEEEIVSILKKQKQEESAEKRGEELLKGLKEGSSIEETARQEKLTVKETGFFARAEGAIPQIGTSLPMTIGAFNLSPDNPYPDKVFEVNDKIYLIKLKSKEEIIREEFGTEKKKLEKKCLIGKNEQYLQDWLKNARLHATIVFNSRFVP